MSFGCLHHMWEFDKNPFLLIGSKKMQKKTRKIKNHLISKKKDFTNLHIQIDRKPSTKADIIFWYIWMVRFLCIVSIDKFIQINFVEQRLFL